MTEQKLVAAIKAIISSMVNDQLPNIHAIMKQHLRMDLRQRDVKARVLNYFDRFEELIEENGLCDTLEGNDKLKCKLLTDNLHPPLLKEQVLLHQELDPSIKSNVPRLFDVIKTEALKNQQSFDTYSAGRDRTSSKPSQKPARNDEKHESTANARSGNEHKPERTVRKTRDPAPTQGCLHCKGPHWVSDCPSATEEQKRTAMQAFMERRKPSEPSKMKRFLHVDEELPFKHVAFNGVAMMPYHLDNGSKHNVIPRTVVNEVCQACPDVIPQKLARPIDGKAVGGAIIRCEESILLNLELLTPAGKVRMRNVSCIITEMDEDEFLLGSLTLKALGIDVDKQFDSLANREVVDFDPFESATPMKFDPPDKSVILEKLQHLVDEAVANGFPHDRKQELLDVITRYDIWRVSIGSDPPSKIEPFVIRFKEGTEPVRCKPRTYAPHEREWMKQFNDNLVSYGWVYRNESSRWASPARPVRKPGKAHELRQTVDFRRVNEKIQPLAGSMPSLSTRLQHAKKKPHKQTVDFIKSFWQMALAQVSQESQSYMTEDGIFTPTRLQQGSVDSSIHFQQSVEKILREAELLYNSVLAWIDDLLIYAGTIDEFLVTLDKVYRTLAKHGLFLGLNKICLYTLNAKWCGRIITPDGITYDPSKIKTLTDMKEPTTIAELQQFLCAAGWMRNSLVDFARIAAPLQNRLQTALSGTRRTKRVAARLPVTLTDAEQDSFSAVKQLLADTAILVTPDEEDELCLFTDASDSGWSIILTVVANWNATIDITEQDHRLVHCMSGTFKDAALHWSVSEKEAYPIIKATTDLDYLLIRSKGFRLYSDHRNLIFIFAPGEEIKKHVRGKLQRWSLKLNELRYTIEHITGEANVWADMASRWACMKPTADTSPMKRVQQHDTSPTSLRPLRPDTEWPSVEDILTAQANATHKPPTSLSKSAAGEWRDNANRLWIPSDATALITRIMVIAHCGIMGHRGVNVMINHLKEHFHIEKLNQQARLFCSNCLLCCHVKGGKIIPRPWGEIYRSSERNDALHMDYLSIGDYNGTSNYLLVLKDDFSHFCELIECSTPDASTAAKAILEWSMRYGMPQLLISDSATHFKNQLLDELCNKTQMKQTFTVAYCPWINGSIERLNRDILQVLRVMLLEFKLPQDKWAVLLPLIESNLNHSPVASLANHAPAEVFLGVKATNPLNKIVANEGASSSNVLTTAPLSIDIAKSVELLRSSISSMHHTIANAKAQQTERNKAHQRGVQPVNFHVGDYVLWSRVDSKLPRNKLSVTWIGPYKVIDAKANSFLIEHLINGKAREAHPSRLKLYADSSFEVSEEILEHIANQDIYLTVQEFKEHRRSATHTFELLVSWEGLEDIEDSWEPVRTMHEDVPTKLLDYISKAQDADLTRFVSNIKTHRDKQARNTASSTKPAKKQRNKHKN